MSFDRIKDVVLMDALPAIKVNLSNTELFYSCYHFLEAASHTPRNKGIPTSFKALEKCTELR